jgi:hypothetical protein
MPLSILVYYRQKSIILKKIYKNSQKFGMLSHSIEPTLPVLLSYPVLPLYPCTSCAYTIRIYLNILSNGKGGM